VGQKAKTAEGERDGATSVRARQSGKKCPTMDWCGQLSLFFFHHVLYCNTTLLHTPRPTFIAFSLTLSPYTNPLHLQILMSYPAAHCMWYHPKKMYAFFLSLSLTHPQCTPLHCINVACVDRITHTTHQSLCHSPAHSQSNQICFSVFFFFPLVTNQGRTTAAPTAATDPSPHAHVGHICSSTTTSPH
jgi:hypothetical protein